MSKRIGGIKRLQIQNLFFYLVDHGLDFFTSAYVRIQSIKINVLQSISSSVVTSVIYSTSVVTSVISINCINVHNKGTFLGA